MMNEVYCKQVCRNLLRHCELREDLVPRQIDCNSLEYVKCLDCHMSQICEGQSGYCIVAKKLMQTIKKIGTTRI